MVVTPPDSISTLLARANALAGESVATLFAQAKREAPQKLLHDKGTVGQLLEQHLGATAGCLSLPDFPDLGVELKTIPVNEQGQPLESTYVCHIALRELCGETWEKSAVRRKLAHVLWVPIVVAHKQQPIALRKIGAPLLWQPTAEQEAIVRQDWQELTDMISLGEWRRINARLGQYLQIRPKAAHGRSLCAAIGEAGEPMATLPRGFYLRARFTAMILQEHYQVK